MSSFKYYISIIVLFFVGLFLSYSNILPFKSLYELFYYEEIYVSDFGSSSNIEITMIYIGHSRCIFSNSVNMYDAIEGAKITMKDFADENSYSFRVIGISTDNDPYIGFNYFKKFGYFDELILGGGWSNIGMMSMLGEMGAETSTPQIITLIREYHPTNRTLVSNERVILTLRGMNIIKDWADNGYLMPGAS
jgi:hypothetical protein